MKPGLHSRVFFLLHQEEFLISPNAFETKHYRIEKDGKICVLFFAYTFSRVKLVEFLKHLENGKILSWEWRERRPSDKRLHYVVVVGESVMPFKHCSYWWLCCHRNSFLHHFWLFRSLPRALCCNPFFMAFSILQKLCILDVRKLLPS